MNNLGILLALVTAFGYSSNYVLMQMGMKKTKNDPGVFISLFSAVVTIILIYGIYLVYMLIGQAPFAPFNWWGIFFFLLAGFVTAFLGRTILIHSIKRIGPSRAAGIKNAAPIFTIIVAVSFMGERITPLAGVGILIIFSALFLQARHEFKQTPADSSRDKKVGMLLACGAAVSFGLGHAIRKQGVLFYPDPILGSLLGTLFALLVLVVGEATQGQLGETIKRNFKQLNGYYIAGGVMTGIAQMSFFGAVMFTNVSYVSVVTATEPVMTVLLSSLLLKKDEKITRRLVVTACAVFVGTTILVLAG